MLAVAKHVQGKVRRKHEFPLPSSNFLDQNLVSDVGTPATDNGQWQRVTQTVCYTTPRRNGRGRVTCSQTWPYQQRTGKCIHFPLFYQLLSLSTFSCSLQSYVLPPFLSFTPSCLFYLTLCCFSLILFPPLPFYFLSTHCQS